MLEIFKKGKLTEAGVEITFEGESKFLEKEKLLEPILENSNLKFTKRGGEKLNERYSRFYTQIRPCNNDFEKHLEDLIKNYLSLKDIKIKEFKIIPHYTIKIEE